MLGIVKAKTPLKVNSVAGIRKMYSQWSSSKVPMMFVPARAPRRPAISERQSAIALEYLKQ